MAGKKIEQATRALQFVLDNLRDDDIFNIVAYDDRVEAFKPELQRYTSQSRAEATRFVENIRPGSGTNIDAGLKAAMALIPDDSRPNYVIFLTDGLPTNGETAELKIAENARAANRGHARIFAFGVGFDVNARLLDRLSGGSGGTSEYVRPDEDIEAHVAAFYAKMTRPVLAGIGIDARRPRREPDLPPRHPRPVRGGPGRLGRPLSQRGRDHDPRAGKVGGQRQAFEFPAELAGVGATSGRDFVEKLWAVRRVGAIIDQIDLNGPNQELTDELVALSTRYGILTPYTSFLADERVQLHASLRNGEQAKTNLGALAITQGASGTEQRRTKQIYSQANSMAEVDQAMIIAAKPADAAKAGTPMVAAASPAIAGGGFAGGGAGMGGAGYVTTNAFPAAAVGAGWYGAMTAGQGQGQGQGQSLGKSPASGVMFLGRGPGLSQHKGKAEGSTTDPAANVRRVGTKTFYRKGGRLVDAEVKPEDDARAIAVEQFGDEYFKLAAQQSAEQNQYFALDEPVTVRIADRVYRVDPPRPTP